MILKAITAAVTIATAALAMPPAHGAPRSAKIPVITVHAKDFAYESPRTIPAGMTSFRLVNDGKVLHHMSIVKLLQGKTLADYMTAMKAHGPPPAWTSAVGGPNAAEPGKSVEATLDLEAGNYVLLCLAGLAKGRTGIFTANLTPGTYAMTCYVPDGKDGKPHSMHGMATEFVVQ